MFIKLICMWLVAAEMSTHFDLQTRLVNVNKIRTVKPLGVAANASSITTIIMQFPEYNDYQAIKVTLAPSPQRDTTLLAFLTDEEYQSFDSILWRFG